MFKFSVLIFSMLLSIGAEAKLLDKILAVVDDKVVTLSQVRRVRDNLAARRNISPQIYNQANYTDKEIVEIFLNKMLIREKLSEIGYVIGDDQVESQIKETERKIGVNRSQLLEFLRSNNVTFDEYFELIRETIEYNIFSSRVIRPLISVTEQEVKNTFYKKNLDNKTLAFRYTLVDFSIESRFIQGKMLNEYKSVLVNFQNNGILPERFSRVETNVLGDITEDGLTTELRKLLKKTDEGSFTNAIKIGNDYHIFFVKKKDLVESDIFTNAKDSIRNQLFMEAAKNISVLWFQREQSKHYVKYFF